MAVYMFSATEWDNVYCCMDVEQTGDKSLTSIAYFDSIIWQFRSHSLAF